MPFTTIVNPSDPSEVHDMTRKLEKPPATRRTTKKPPAKKETAMLVLANGEPLGESARLGLSLVGAGLTGGAIGLLEGMARRGKFEWWAKLSPRTRGMVMVAFTIVAGAYARHLRRQGKHKPACGLEAAAISGWTLAIVYFTEGPGTAELQGLGDISRRKPDDINLDELKALDAQIDDDIRGAVDRLKDLAAEQAQVQREQRESGDVGALAIEGDSLIDLDDDDDPQF